MRCPEELERCQLKCQGDRDRLSIAISMATTDYSDNQTPTVRNPTGGESAWETPNKADGGLRPMYGHPGSYGEATLGNGPIPGSVTYDSSGSRSMVSSSI